MGGVVVYVGGGEMVVWCSSCLVVGAGLEVGVWWPGLDQCLMSPGRRDTGLVCLGPVSLSALSRRHSATRHGDDTVTQE